MPLILLLILLLIPFEARGEEAQEWFLVEHFQVVVYPTGERIQQSVPISGPYEHHRHLSVTSCNRAWLILSRHLTAEELQRIKCEERK